LGLPNAVDGAPPDCGRQKTSPWWKSGLVPIVVYKRSWRETFSDGGTKKEKRTKKERKIRKGRLVESAAAEEINKVACGDIFLMISTSCLEALLGSHTYHKPDDY